VAAPSLAVLDNFNRANGGLGSNWTTGLYAGTVAPQISSNAVQGDPSFAEAYWNVASYTDTEVFKTITTQPATGDLTYLWARGQVPGTAGADAYELVITKQAGTDLWELNRVIDNTPTNLASRNQELANGDTMGLVVLGTGATVTLQIWYRPSGGSWTQLGADVSDSNAARIVAAGRIGAGSNSSTERWDDFGGGEQVASGATFDTVAASTAPAPTSAAVARLNEEQPRGWADAPIRWQRVSPSALYRDDAIGLVMGDAFFGARPFDAPATSTAPAPTSAALSGFVGGSVVTHDAVASSTAPAPTSAASAAVTAVNYAATSASTAPAPTSAALSAVTQPAYAATATSTAPAPTSQFLASRAASLRFYGVTTGNVGRVRIPLTSGGGSVATAVNVGAGDFTYEMWINGLYADNAATTALDVRYSNILLDRDIWNDSRGHVLGVARSGSNLVVLFGVAGAGSWTTIVGTIHVGDGQWHHIAVDRNAATGVITIYVDGTADGNSTYTTGTLAYPTGYTPTGGQNNEYIVLGTEKHDVGGNGYTGLMDEVRISDNRRYTANFTRPSAPFTPDANTAGLYHADNAPGAVLRDYATISGAPTDGALLIGGTSNGPTWQVESPFSTTSHPATAASTAPAATSAALSAVTQPGYAGVAASTAPAPSSAALSAVTQPGYAGVASSVAPAPASAALSAVTQPAYAATTSSTAPAATSAATAASAAPGGSAATTSSTAPAPASTALAAFTVPAYAGQAATSAPGATSAALGAVTQPAYPATAASTAQEPTSAAQAASSAPGANTATAASSAPAPTSAALSAVTQPSYSATTSTSAPAPTSQASAASAIPAYDVTGASIAPIPVSAAGASAAQPAYAVTAISTAPAPTSQAQASNATSYTVVAMAVAPAPSSQALAAHSVGGIGSLTLTIAAVGGMSLSAAAVGALDLGIATVGSVALTIEPE
jgi:Concanavalin A-like lectin/glucanases superfamily